MIIQAGTSKIYSISAQESVPNTILRLTRGQRLKCRYPHLSNVDVEFQGFNLGEISNAFIVKGIMNVLVKSSIAPLRFGLVILALILNELWIAVFIYYIYHRRVAVVLVNEPPAISEWARQTEPRSLDTGEGILPQLGLFRH